MRLVKNAFKGTAWGGGGVKGKGKHSSRVKKLTVSHVLTQLVKKNEAYLITSSLMAIYLHST